MMNISILYITCNIYSNLWIPYLKLAKKYERDTIKTYLCTDLEISNDLLVEIQEYHVEILIYGEKSNMSKGGNFYKRLIFYLNEIKTQNILFQVDDMLPRNIINKNSLSEVIEILDNNDNIKFIKISAASPHHTGDIFTYKNKKYTFSNNMKPDSYLFSVQPICIKNEFFIKYLNWCELNHKKYNITHLNGGLELLGGHYFKINHPNFMALKSHENICMFYTEPHGVIKHGIINQNADLVLKKKENIELKLFSNNTIFQVTENELNLFGTHNTHMLKKTLQL